MQEITAHGSIVRRDQSDVQNRINVWESSKIIFAASKNVGLFRHGWQGFDQKLMQMYGIFDGFAWNM